MKSIQLLELLRHIDEKTRCPECAKKIFASAVEIEASTEHSAFLKIKCPHCGRDLRAHVFLNLPDNFGKNPPPDGFLDNFAGDISDLFPPR